MKIATWNVNGLRAADTKGFTRWVETSRPDVLCMQEVKAEPEQLPLHLREPGGYRPHWHWATRKRGYSGVATWLSRPVDTQSGCGVEAYDCEGRVLETRFEDFTLFNIYFPNGSRDHSRVPFKLRFYEDMLSEFGRRMAAGEHLVVCGDFNTAHTEIDLANPRANAKTTGFLPEERAWIDRYLAAGFRDVFRERHPGEKGHYSWWSYRPGVRERNIGWRIDYFLVSENLANSVRGCEILSDVQGSDHCPVVLELA